MKHTQLKRKSSLKRSVGTLSKVKRKVSPQGKNKPSKPKSRSLSKLKKELDRLVKELYRRIILSWKINKPKENETELIT